MTEYKERKLYNALFKAKKFGDWDTDGLTELEIESIKGLACYKEPYCWLYLSMYIHDWDDERRSKWAWLP